MSERYGFSTSVPVTCDAGSASEPWIEGSAIAEDATSDRICGDQPFRVISSKIPAGVGPAHLGRLIDPRSRFRSSCDDVSWTLRPIVELDVYAWTECGAIDGMTEAGGRAYLMTLGASGDSDQPSWALFDAFVASLSFAPSTAPA